MSRLISVNTQVLADPEKLFQPAPCSASLHTTVTQGLSPCQLTLKTTTADALTLLLHNQHALAAALEGVTKWISENGVESVAANPMGPWMRWPRMHEPSLMRLCAYASYRHHLKSAPD